MDEELALIGIGAIILIIVWGFVAAEFRRIAALKGHDEAKYFWWTFLLGPVGMMMVVALPHTTEPPIVNVLTPQPPVETHSAPKTYMSDELPDI